MRATAVADTVCPAAGIVRTKAPRPLQLSEQLRLHGGNSIGLGLGAAALLADLLRPVEDSGDFFAIHSNSQLIQKVAHRLVPTAPRSPVA